MNMRRDLSVLLVVAVTDGLQRPPASQQGAIDRRGLESQVGQQWSGDSARIVGARREFGWAVNATRSGAAAARHVISFFRMSGRQVAAFSVAGAASRAGATWRIVDAVWLPATARERDHRWNVPVQRAA
jgi:hypothetical protein